MEYETTHDIEPAKDPFNQLNCVVRGRKHGTVVEPVHIKKITLVIEDGVPSEHNSGGIVTAMQAGKV